MLPDLREAGPGQPVFSADSESTSRSVIPGPDDRRSRSVPHTALLIGAHGSLGRFMCLDWPERLSVTGGRLVCVVRNRDGADTFDSGDA
ncbi:hypothetical protein [Streptomyces canus]|uniref:hypothetical protein n=1 Tax=Streptomyces canus TaxID=58343 RepID=UPI002782D459|nr:hypothetical protein [Streptomyces canus]MDQ0757885.1 hypothetical protein [Streptomyces canus]MDQ1073380.1 hypothetical protein [Streptomyces canus]